MNFIAVAAIRSVEKFWLIQVFTWILLFIFFIIFNTNNKNELEQKELTSTVQTQTEGNEDQINFIEFDQEKKSGVASFFLLMIVYAMIEFLS